MIQSRTELERIKDMSVEQISQHIDFKFKNRRAMKEDYCYNVLDTLSLLEQYDIKYPGLQDKMNKVLENY